MSEIEFPFPNKAVAGSELMLMLLEKYTGFDRSLFNIILSVCHPDNLSKSGINILWQHVDSNQQSVLGLSNTEFIESLDAIVFVSNWQYHSYRNRFNLPLEKCHVIKNAIEPIEFAVRKKLDDVLRIIYCSTPWRGLDVLLDAFEGLNQLGVELHVFSSTGIYGRAFYEAHDHEYHHLYDRARQMEGVFYRGYVPNSVLRGEMQRAHIFAYPSTWAETFCVSAVEAASAGLELVVTNLGALPEILGNNATYTPYTEDKAILTKRFRYHLQTTIERLRREGSLEREYRSRVFNHEFSWHRRSRDWQILFNGLRTMKNRENS